MERLFHFIAERWHLSHTEYMHLRLVCAVTVVPLLAVLYLVLFDRKREQPRFPRLRYPLKGSRPSYTFRTTKLPKLRPDYWN